MEDDPEIPALPVVTRADVARGAGLAGLSRMGALIEALAQPLYTWLFGLATYGIYVVLWGAVNLATNIVHLSMPLALQREVPRQDEDGAHGAVKLALLVALIPSTLIALFASLGAGTLVVRVERHELRVDSEVREKPPRDARVLGRDHVGARQRLDRSLRDVTQIPDGSRHHI